MTKKLRADLKVIADLVKPGSTLLDVGCGRGELLRWLTHNKQVDGRGLELSQEKVSECVASGLSVIQGDVDTDLPHYPDQAYDYAVLTRTLQAMNDPSKVLDDLIRIGKHVIVSLPNFAYWKNRFYLGFKGRMPVTKSLPYEWHNTPNIHFCTIQDFVVLCEEKGIEIERRVYVDHAGMVSPFTGKGRLANIFGEQGVFLLKKQEQ